MPSLRVDLVFLLLATIVTIVLIKLTALLPASLYFNFSSAFSDDLGAFLVPRPVLEARQQCELARAKGFTFKPCPTGADQDDAFTEERRTLLAQAFIEVQSAHQKGDVLVADASPASSDIATLAETIAQDLSTRDSIADFRTRRALDLASTIGTPFTEEVYRKFERLDGGAGTTDADVAPEGEGEPAMEGALEGESGLDTEGGIDGEAEPFAEPEPEPADPALAEMAQKLAEAEQSMLSEFSASKPLAVRPFTLPEIETVLAAPTTSWQAVEKLRQAFIERLAAAIRKPFDEKIMMASIDIDARQTEVERAVLAQTGWQYALALAIRLAVPFTAAALLALAVGVGMRLSIATGCAFSAFLLAWPVVLLWNGVIDPAYHDLRGVFYGFYVAYVVSFFTLGWLGTTVGAIGHAYWKIPYRAQSDETPRLAGVNALARQLPLQLVTNIATNGITLVFSFIFFGDVGFKL